MPIASPEIYNEMLDRAKAGAFAYPAINCTSSQTIVAAIQGFAEAESDGIVQVSWGGAEYASGQKVKDMVIGSVALAEFAHSVAKGYGVNIALHTDHCPAEKLDGFMRPLVQISADRVKAGQEPLFQSHMWDGSAVSMKENLAVADEMLDKCAAARTIAIHLKGLHFLRGFLDLDHLHNLSQSRLGWHQCQHQQFQQHIYFLPSLMM